MSEGPNQTAATRQPTCSIVMPCYNRAHFLPGAFEAINAQTFRDWELIIVDDGSRDDTRAVVEKMAPGARGAVRYFHQANAGAGAARNTGIDHAAGRYIAFYDSDDLWLPAHLGECVGALEANADVDWVFAACRSISMDEANRVVQENNFYHPDGTPREFLALRGEERGELHVITDPNVVPCAIHHGLHCGFQTSVYRARVFEKLRLPPFRVGEDQVLTIETLKRGYRPAYFNQVQIVYRIHSQNVSGSRLNSPTEHRIGSARQVIEALESLPGRVALTRPERAALHRRLSEEYFWKTGYTLFLAGGDRQRVLADLHRGLHYSPGNLVYWKSYLATRVKYLLGCAPKPSAAVEP